MAFDFKIALCWLPHMGDQSFPCLFNSDLDDALIDSYQRYLPQVKEAGFDWIRIEGVFGENGPGQMPADLDRGFSPQRERQIRLMLDLVHEAGLKYLHCLPVFSAGFSNIMAHHPQTRGRRYRFRGLGSRWAADHTMRHNADLIDLYDDLEEEELPFDPNARGSLNRPRLKTLPRDDVMCGSSPQAWDWQQRVIRFLIDRYEIDGFDQHAADVGRCMCPQCRRIDNLSYHAHNMKRVTQFIRSIAPNTIIGATTFGARIDGLRTLPAIQEMAHGVDYFIDPTSQHLIDVVMLRQPSGPAKVLINDRPKVIEALGPVAYGPVLHARESGLERHRWMTPCPRILCEAIAQAHRDGCRAVEYYAIGAFANAGSELNHYVTGHALHHCDEPWRQTLEEVVGRLYRPRSSAARRGLADLFSELEISCLYNDVQFNMLDPTDRRPIPCLVETSVFQLLRHERELGKYLEHARTLKSDIGDEQRAQKLLRCLKGAQDTVATEAQRRIDEDDE